MKRLLITLVMSALSVFSARAQQSSFMEEPFRHLAFGAEVGTMGAGVQLAMPVAKNHVVLVLGYNLPISPSLGYDIGIKPDLYLQKVDDLNRRIDNDVVKHPEREGHYEKFDRNAIGSKVNVDAKGKILFENFKALLELYPSARSTFHFTAGVMIGNGDFIELSGSAEEAVQEHFRVALCNQEYLREIDEIGQDEDLVRYTLRYSLDGVTYGLNDEVAVDATIRISKVKPYLGIGFGNAVPRKHVGFQFELGAWYHGTPKVESPNALPEFDRDAEKFNGVIKVIEQVNVYPQITFRLTGRLF